MATSRLCTIETSRDCFVVVRFTVDINSLVERAKPQNGGETKRRFTAERSLRGLAGLESQLPPSDAHHRGGRLNGHSPAIPRGPFFWHALTAQPHSSNILLYAASRQRAENPDSIGKARFGRQPWYQQQWQNHQRQSKEAAHTAQRCSFCNIFHFPKKTTFSFLHFYL